MENSFEAAEQRADAIEYFFEAFDLQKQGEFRRAINSYQKSIELYPSAQAYTFMGWTYSYLGRLPKAIECCRKAIKVDPDFGNAYNDIGAYLIDLGRGNEAIPYLRKAIRARRYDCCHYAWYNLGRIYEADLRMEKAKDAYARSVRLVRSYGLAEKALLRVIAATN
jgi:tetratricopeptide (TPR) repeat protein